MTSKPSSAHNPCLRLIPPITVPPLSLRLVPVSRSSRLPTSFSTRWAHLARAASSTSSLPPSRIGFTPFQPLPPQHTLRRISLEVSAARVRPFAHTATNFSPLFTRHGPSTLPCAFSAFPAARLTTSLRRLAYLDTDTRTTGSTMQFPNLATPNLALQRTRLRVTSCALYRRRLATHHATPEPPSAVAELGVVRHHSRARSHLIALHRSRWLHRRAGLLRSPGVSSVVSPCVVAPDRAHQLQTVLRCLSRRC